MTPLPDAPNRSTPYVIKEGDTGWPVFACQRGLKTLGARLEADGDFGKLTLEKVKMFQLGNALEADGIAGPATQAAIVKRLDVFTHDHNDGLPAGLVRGFSEAEGGNKLGAVNWSVEGGVDCGVMQIRCYGPPFSQDKMRYAFAPGAAMQATATAFMDRYSVYRKMSYASRSREFAKRCAALAHNWPWAAEQYARNGRLPDPNRIATWVPLGVRFPDGTPVRTWADWAQFYALSGPHGEGRVTQYVRDW